MRNLRSELDKTVADATARLAELTERCRETEDRANDVTAGLQARWQRRTELMRSRSNTQEGARNVQ